MVVTDPLHRLPSRSDTPGRSCPPTPQGWGKSVPQQTVSLVRNGFTHTIMYEHKTGGWLLEAELHCKPFGMWDIPQVGIKPSGLPLWGTVVCAPDTIMLLTFTLKDFICISQDQIEMYLIRRRKTTCWKCVAVEYLRLWNPMLLLQGFHYMLKDVYHTVHLTKGPRLSYWPWCKLLFMIRDDLVHYPLAQM